MDQLVVLQEIYASFSKGKGSLKEIDINAIEGCCRDLVARLLEDSLNGRIEEGICQELSEKLTDVYELKRLGDICRQAGHFRLATETYKRAISLCLDPVLSPILKNNLGQAYVDQGDMRRALSCYQEAAEIFSREGDRISLAHVLGNLGSAYRKMGDSSRAIEHAHRSLKIFEEDGDSLGIAQMTGSIGRIYADMGERELAGRYFERSLADFQRQGDKRGAAWILSRLGWMARESGDLDRALGYMHSSISIWEEMGESANLGAVLADLGTTLVQMGQPSAARSPLERAVLLIPEHSRPDYQKALSSLARAYSSLAEESIREAIKADGPGTPSGQEMRKEAARLFVRSADRYQELAEILPQRKNETIARAALARGRSYLSRINEQTPDPEAILLAEKAMAALDSAASSSNEEKKDEILALQKVTAGLCQARRADKMTYDLREIRSALSCSAEYLLKAAEAHFPSGAGETVRRALESLKSAIEAEIPVIEQKNRQEAASALRQAKLQYAAEETAISRMIEKAAEMLEAPDRLPEDGEDAGILIDDEQEDGRRSWAWEKDRAALLALSEAMIVSDLSDIKDDERPGREDLPEQSDRDRSEAEPIFLNIADDGELNQEIGGEASLGSDGRQSWEEKAERERDLVLADEGQEGAYPQSWLGGGAEKRIWDDPAQVFQNGSCQLLPKGELPMRKSLFRVEASTEAFSGMEERLGADKPIWLESESERVETIEPLAEGFGQRYDGTVHRDEAPDEEMEDAGPQFAPAGDDLEVEEEIINPISPRIILALKVLSALILLLLGLEILLYLI